MVKRTLIGWALGVLAGTTVTMALAVVYAITLSAPVSYIASGLTGFVLTSSGGFIGVLVTDR